MFKNRNGYWMDPRFSALYAPDGGAGTGGESGTAGDAAPGGDASNVGNASGEGAEGGKSTSADSGSDENSADKLNAEIARLNAEMAKQKAALDKATREAGDARKALKAKMTQEEIDAESKKEAEEKRDKEIEELRRRVARGDAVKTIMGKLGMDEGSAGNLADHLYGAADIENALLEIQKVWQAREKALRLEFGKVPPPGAGADSNSPEAQAIARASAFGKARNEANEQAQKAMSAYIR